MQKTRISLSVNEAVERLKAAIQEKGFGIFAEIDHRQNAQGVDLDMPDSRVLIFGNPLAGTKLMQKDIFMSLDLPLRLAVVERDGETWLLHQQSGDYAALYDVEGHPVLEKIDSLFAALSSEVNA